MSESLTEFDVDGHVDVRGVRYLGKATRQPDGTWRSLAVVGTALCIVECKIIFNTRTVNHEPARTD